MATVPELEAQLRDAKTEEDIAAVEAQAEGRVGVISAVEAARARLQAERDAPSQGQASGGNASAQIAEGLQGRHVGGGKPSQGGVKAPTAIRSAEEHERIPDALGNEPQRRDPLPMDRTAVVEIDGHEAAVPSEDSEVGPHGLALPQAGEIGGGNIAKLLEAPPSTETLQNPLSKEQAAMTKPVYQKIAALSGRPPTEMGIIGPGETIRGHMLLLDLNTGEKVRAMDGHRVNRGELFMNLRNVPESLATGDVISRVLEATA
jgi:hypothetical protein